MNSNMGYSYKITITAEELSMPSSLSGASKKAFTYLQPPSLDAARTPTKLATTTVSSVHYFAFNKIVEPRYDGIGKYTGEPVNFPDFISEHHFIGLMRASEIGLNPNYEAIIVGSTGSTGT